MNALDKMHFSTQTTNTENRSTKYGQTLLFCLPSLWIWLWRCWNLRSGVGARRWCTFNRLVIPHSQLIGVDLSPKPSRSVRNDIKESKDCNFELGDAENLPLVDGSRDIVLNIESSHCYPDFFVFRRSQSCACRWWTLHIYRLSFNGRDWTLTFWVWNGRLYHCRCERHYRKYHRSLRSWSISKNRFYCQTYPRWMRNLLKPLQVWKVLRFMKFSAQVKWSIGFVLRKTTMHIAEVSVELE